MKKPWILVCLSMTMLMLWTKLAFAAPDGPTAVTRVGYDVVALLACAIGIVIMVLIARVTHYIGTAYKINIPDPWMAQITKLIDSGIGYAEEQGRKAVKKLDAKLEPIVPDKLEIAANFVLDAVDDSALVAKGKEWLKQQIEARLSTQRPEWQSLTTLRPIDPFPLARQIKPMTPMLDGKTVASRRRLNGMGDVYVVTFTDGTSGEYTGMQLAIAGVTD